jgi:hypothetical protein
MRRQVLFAFWERKRSFTEGCGTSKNGHISRPHQYRSNSANASAAARIYLDTGFLRWARELGAGGPTSSSQNSIRSDLTASEIAGRVFLHPDSDHNHFFNFLSSEPSSRLWAMQFEFVLGGQKAERRYGANQEAFAVCSNATFCQKGVIVWLVNFRFGLCDSLSVLI